MFSVCKSFFNHANAPPLAFSAKEKEVGGAHGSNKIQLRPHLDGKWLVGWFAAAGDASS